MNAKHTPGPWRMEPFVPEGDTLVVRDEWGTFVVADAGRTDSKVAQANARLIAEAPAMAAELRSAVEYIETLTRDTAHWDIYGAEISARLRAILARIDGAQS